MFPLRYLSLARYLAKYVVSPPIALRRIDRYDGHRVTLTTVPTKASGSSKKRWRSTPLLGVWCSISSQGLPNGFVLRGPSDQNLCQAEGRIQAALAKVNGLIKGTIKIVAP